MGFNSALEGLNNSPKGMQNWYLFCLSLYLRSS